MNFGLSELPQGVISFSRILADEEVLVVANTHPTLTQTLHVIADGSLNKAGSQMSVRFSNRPQPTSSKPLRLIGQASVAEADGNHSVGPVMTCRVTLQPLEVQILSPAS